MKRFFGWAVAVFATACGGQSIDHASADPRPSHNQLYVVSAEPVMVDKETGWVNIKVEVKSELGTDSVAFNMILK
jgi:hypothetical protein